MPIPGLSNLVAFVNSVIRMSLTYVDEIILGYNVRLDSNQLTEIPPQLGQLTALTRLDLDGNQLVYDLPSGGSTTALVALRHVALPLVANALAGVVTDQSGRVLTFALISNNAGPEGRTALDGLAFETRPFYSGNPWFLAPSIMYYRIKDSLPI